MYVCMNVCMIVCMYVWMYVCMYVCTTCAKKKTEHSFRKSKTSRRFLKKSDNINFDVRGRAESRKIVLETLRWAVFEQTRLFSSKGQSKTCIKLREKKRCTFSFRFWLLPLLENIKSWWGLERKFQSAYFERNRSFLALFVWEISKNEVNKAHKANDASSWWWNECMMMWLHDIRLVYLLLQVFARK